MPQSQRPNKQVFCNCYNCS